MKKNEEFLVTAFALPSSGPGWANQPVVAVLQKIGSEEIHLIWLQPEEQTVEILQLYKISSVVNSQFSRLVATLLGITTY
jgi:hypothetical protein